MNTPTRLVRQAARRVVLDALSAAQALKTPSAEEDEPSVSILLLHGVARVETDAFSRLLSRLAKRYEFVSYSEAIAAACGMSFSGRKLAFSFDDGQSSCRTAAELLGQHGATACFFVCPAVVGERDQSTLDWFCSHRLRHARCDFMDWPDLENLLRQGHEIGGHTMNHVNLGACSASEATEEIYDCHSALSRRTGVPRHFAWPYGTWNDITHDRVRDVFRAGFESCASGVRGAHTHRTVAEGRPLPDWRQACVRRQSIQAAWPQRHIEYFLRRGERRLVELSQSTTPEACPNAA